MEEKKKELIEKKKETVSKFLEDMKQIWKESTDYKDEFEPQNVISSSDAVFKDNIVPIYSILAILEELNLSVTESGAVLNVISEGLPAVSKIKLL